MTLLQIIRIIRGDPVLSGESIVRQIDR